ncbi:hypothetical protein [Ignatzschineria indica]|nr:hypothetical protein [Ignatzschineria indica]
MIDQNKRAVELPETTTAYFHKFHAGKRQSLTAGNYRLIYSK